MIHEIEYYCFVNKEKHCQNTHLNFLRLPEILLLCKQTGFKCFFPKEDMIFTLDDLKMKIKQEYGVPKHLQILRKYTNNMPENKGVKQIENECLIPYFFEYHPTFVFGVLPDKDLVIEELPVDCDGNKMLLISPVTIKFRGQIVKTFEITENTTILEIKRDLETTYDLDHTKQELYFIYGVGAFVEMDPIFLQDSQNLIELILDLENGSDQNVSLHLDLKLEETEIEKWCKDNELVYLNEINVYLINKTLLIKVSIEEIDIVDWDIEELETIINVYFFD